jgi:hypothetical protein
VADLNNIPLPVSLVAGIYKNHLVEPGQLSQSEPVTAKKRQAAKAGPATIQYLGQNQKGVCLLVDYADDVHLPDSQLVFLTNILQACKLNLGDVAIINCNRQQVSVSSLLKQFSCNHLLIFGAAAGAIDLQELPLFSVQTEDKLQLVRSPAAENLNSSGAESKLLKSKLWACLKEMFGV